MARFEFRRMAVWASLGAVLVLGACTEGGPAFLRGGGNAGGDTTGGDGASVRLVDRDVESPEVFQVTAEGLWDGRPSLGGVWVAHPDVTDPERVIIRNESNGKFVIGALFRRERENPGPVFQVSSDAAAALGMLAGAPATLNVTALRRQEVPIAEETTGGEADGEGTEGGEGEVVETTTLDGADDAGGDTGGGGTEATAATAAAAIAAAEARATPTATAPARGSPLDKPFIQLGLFSAEANANRAGDKLRAAGIIPVIKKGTSQGKPFWRVLAGPATSRGERSALLRKVKEMGYADAYFVSN